MPTLSQAAYPLTLNWTQGDPVHLEGVLPGKAAFAGAATVQSETPTIQDHMTVTLVADNADALITIDLAAGFSALLTAGEYEYEVHSAAGVTLIEGPIFILEGAGSATSPGPNMTLITAQDVFDWMSTPKVDDSMLALMTKVVRAVIVRISRGWEAPELGQDDDWILAHIMQSARIWKRKVSPEGVIANDQFGAIRVTRIDSDIADMLVDFAKAPFA